MKKHVFLARILATVVFFSTWSVAQAPMVEPAGITDSTAAPPLEALVASALERSPSLAALNERLAAAREMVTAAGALADPMVEVMLQDVSFPRYTVGTMEMSMIGPGVSQALPYPGKRAARRAVAQQEAEIQAAGIEASQRELVAQVRSLYARLWALDQERVTLAAARQLLDMLAATAAMRYSVGEAEQEAVIKAQLEVSRLDERSDDLEAERSILVAALNRLLDQSGATPLGRVTALPPIGVPAQPWEDAVLVSSAEITVRRAAVAAAERRVDLLRLDLRPDFTTGAAVGLRGGFDPVVTLRFGVELPLWRNERQRPMIRAAEHELEMARAEVREAEAAALSQVARLRAEWERANKQIVRYRDAVIPQSSAAVDAARSSYLAGRGDFSTAVEDFRLWLEARSELARREADRFVTWAELDLLLGEATETGPGSGDRGAGSDAGRPGSGDWGRGSEAGRPGAGSQGIQGIAESRSEIHGGVR